MANDDHLQILKQGVDAWDKWRQDNPKGRPDLRRAQLGGAKLSGMDLTETDLSGAVLRGADLSQAMLYQANLRGNDPPRRGPT